MNHRQIWVWGLVVSVILGALAACQRPAVVAPAATLLPAPVTASAAASAAAPMTGTPVVGAAAGAVQPAPAPGAQAQNRQLVVWMPVFSGLITNDAAAGVLQSAFHQYELAHSDLDIDAQVKAETGTASMLQLLRSAQTVAPSILPDLVLINTQQLWQLADLGLVAPLAAEEWAGIDDFYPFALDAVTYRDEVYGIPYAVDVVHGVAAPDAEGPLPTSWPALIDQGGPYLFPGSSAEGYQVGHALLQYVGAGGELVEDGAITDPDALSAYFAYLAESRQKDVIPSVVANLATAGAVLSVFLDEPAGVAAIQANTLLELPEAADLTFAQVPTRNGPPVTVGETWALAILTQDPARRETALDLVAVLLDPEVQGAWSEEANHLPSRRSALQRWSLAPAYREFLDAQLVTALAIPNGRAFAEFARRLQSIQAAVLRGELNPDEASIIMGGG